MTLPHFSTELFWLFAGVALGGVYFVLLGRTVAAIETNKNWQGAAIFLVLRVLLVAVVLVLAAAQGSAALILALLGFLAARAFAIRRIKRQT